MPYDGSPEIKDRNGKKYLYIRKRVVGKLTSTYVDVYSEDLYNLLLKNAKEARELKKLIRKIDKELLNLGYKESVLSKEVLLNIDFAKINIKTNIYDQAVLEGIATTFPQTEAILDNSKVVGVKASDVQKILNLKHAWEFILDKDVISYKSNYYILTHIAKLVNEGFFIEGGKIREVPVNIGGTSYVPPIPIEVDVKEKIDNIINSNNSEIDKAISLCLYCMKTQIFNDGNKRAAVIFANHYLISKGKGLIIIPKNYVSKFKKLLVLYYEGKDKGEIFNFIKKYCLKTV